MKDSTSCPNFCIFLGIVLPVFVFAVIYWLPKNELETDQDDLDREPHDNFLLKTAFALTFLILACCCLCCVILSSNFSL